MPLWTSRAWYAILMSRPMPVRVAPLNPATEIAETELTTSKRTLSAELVSLCASLGVRYAFGLTGGANTLFVDALGKSSVRVVHCRHEGGAGFAAAEAYFACGAPSLVFATTGPGILNALNGLLAARWEGAKVILISGITSAEHRGRWSAQETSAFTLPVSQLFSPGPLFHYAEILESPRQLRNIATRLTLGLQRPQGFIGHVAMPIAAQLASSSVVQRPPALRALATGCSEAVAAQCAELLQAGPFVIWTGFGARSASIAIRALAERTGAHVMSTPRAKGIFPEDHPLYIGVTGMGGHDNVETQLARILPRRALVLGTRLGEGSSFWTPELAPPEGFIHVDIDPDVPGAAYPNVPTLAVTSEILPFVEALLRNLQPSANHAFDLPGAESRPQRPVPLPASDGVRATALMQSIQRVVVDGSDAIVMAESGNAFAWASQELRFVVPNRYRVSTGYGSMGHFVTGVVGAALARAGKAVAIVGDGAMLMNSEVSTAAQHGVPAVWIVLNDACYSMVEQGMLLYGCTPVDSRFPRADFAAIGRAMGADGMRVSSEAELDAALQRAMEAEGPFIVDVIMTRDEASPLLRRAKSLMRQSAANESRPAATNLDGTAV